MNRNRAWIILAVCMSLGRCCLAELPVLRVYLPRQITVSASSLSLADVAVVASEDDAASLKAQQISLGRGPHSREGLRIDRALLVSRLVAAGFDKSQIRLSGADAVTVRRREVQLEAAQIVRAAAKLLDSQLGGQNWKLTSKPKELYYPSQSAARVRAELVKHEGNQAIVEIRVELDGRVLASARLEYRKGVEVRRVVAVTDLSSGTPLTARNVRFESVIVYEDPKNYPAEPFGQMVNRAVPAGGEITADLLDKIEKKVLVRRNQPVVMEISTPSYTIRASGLALQDGKSGDLIQVRNTDSKSIVVARVRFDGTLVPVLQEGQKQ